jgi:hypothetical protein
MTSDILEVCGELDDLMIRALELMEEHIQCKLKLQEIMKSSCLDLAKARYIMGTHNVSYLQLPTEESAEIRALRTVTASVGTGKNLEHTVFKLCTVNQENVLSEKQEEEGRLRKRTGKDEENCKERDDLSPKKCEGIGLVTATDPIKWFGCLVPQNLRQAQKGFHTTLEVVIQSANIQSELEATRKKVEKLLKLKADLTTCKSEL